MKNLEEHQVNQELIKALKETEDELRTSSSDWLNIPLNIRSPK